MTHLVILVAVVLCSLTGCAQAKTLDGQATARFALEVVGLLAIAVLFYVTLSGAIMALFSRARRSKRQLVKHRRLSEFAEAAPRPSREAGDVRHD